MKDYVRRAKARGRETFVPLSHPPGHAQVDFGEAVAVIGGVHQKIHFFCLDLPQSDACFVKAYPRETTEAFLDGHVSSFAFFGGVPLSILYDNLKIAVAKICGDGKRERTRAFTELVSHYLFQDRFGRPGKGNDKGKVEGLVKFSRSNFMTPIPVGASFEAHAKLADHCRRRQSETAGRHAETIGERLTADLAALWDLPAVPLEPCEKRIARVSSTALVRYRGNDYSVPTAYGFQAVLVKGFVDEVVILCDGAQVARHVRSYGQGGFVYDPLHYLALIETKPNALDQAAALQGWDLPPVFQHLRHLLEARMGNKGKREFIQILRLTNPDRYDPRINRTFQDMARHYGTSVVPARPYMPRDKAKVERSVLLVERWLNLAISELVAELNARVLFAAVDAPALKPLAPAPYAFAVWKRCRVAPDYHVQVDGCWYSVPYRLIRELVDVRIADRTIEAFHKGERVASHAKAPGRRGHTTIADHMPSAHRRHASWTPARITAVAEKIGPATAALTQAIMTDRPIRSRASAPASASWPWRRPMAGRARKAACQRGDLIKARSVGSVGSIRSILKTGLDRAFLDPEPEPQPLRHGNIRGRSYFH